MSAAQEALMLFHLSVKKRKLQTTQQEELIQSQGSTKPCIAVLDRVAVTGWPADWGFVCDRAEVCWTG